MKKIKWKVFGFVCWILSTMLLLNIGIKAVNQPDTATNVLGGDKRYSLDIAFDCDKLFYRLRA